MKISILIIFLFLISYAHSQTLIFGLKCPILNLIKNVNIQKYMGRWFEIERNFALFQMGIRCTTLDYCINPKDQSIQIKNSGFGLLNFGNEPMVQTGSAWPKNGQNFAHLSTKFEGLFSVIGDYRILATDYDKFSVVWSCRDVLLGHEESIWILSRNRTLDPGIMEQIHNELNRLRIKLPLTSVEHKNCPNSPNPSSPICSQQTASSLNNDSGNNSTMERNNENDGNINNSTGTMKMTINIGNIGNSTNKNNGTV